MIEFDKARFARDLEGLEGNYAWQTIQKHITDETVRASLAGSSIAVKDVGDLWKIAQYQGKVQGFKSVLDMPGYLMRGNSPPETTK